MGDSALRRWLRAVGIGVLIAGALLFVLVISAPVDARPSGDAVVVHAGGQGERLARALELMEGGVAPVLVVMYGDHPEFPQAPELCGRTEPYVVLCPSPHLESTMGEARELAELTEEHGWDRIVVVTTDYHLRRAKLIDSRCVDAELVGVSASRPLSPWGWVYNVGHEMLGLVQAAVFTC